MLDYTDLKKKEGMEPWPAMKELPFIDVLEGDPQHKGRFDVGGFGLRTMAGVWECTPGKFRNTYPGDEICTILEGKLKTIDENGKLHEYGPGDIFYARKGEVVTWEILETIYKVFYIHDPDAEQLSEEAA